MKNKKTLLVKNGSWLVLGAAGAAVALATGCGGGGGGGGRAEPVDPLANRPAGLENPVPPDDSGLPTDAGGNLILPPPPDGPPPP